VPSSRSTPQCGAASMKMRYSYRVEMSCIDGRVGRKGAADLWSYRVPVAGVVLEPMTATTARDDVGLVQRAVRRRLALAVMADERQSRRAACAQRSQRWMRPREVWAGAPPARSFL
jgi:hypothetical protein